MDRVQFVAEQLRNSAPDVQWTQGGIDRSIELAQILTRAGITDLWALQLIPVTKVIEHPGQWVGQESGDVWHPAWTETVKTFAFSYYGRRVGFLGTPTRQDSDDVFQTSDAGYLLAWSAEGHGHVGYVVAPSPDRKTLRITPVWGSSSEAGEIRGMLTQALAFFALVALPMAGVSLGSVIGSAVLPSSIVASYPAVATIVGNVAISAALNGGDIESAVKGAAISAATGFAGAEVGGFAANAANSELFGSVVNVATRTALAGGDVKKAVATELISKGVTGMSAEDNFIFSSLPAETPFGTDPILTLDPVPYSPTDLPEIEYTIPSLPPIPIPEIEYGTPSLSVDPITWNPFPANWSEIAATGSTGNVFNPGLATVPSSSSSAFAPTNIVQGITQAALSAMSLIKAYRELDRPSIQSTARVVRSNGAVSVIGNNGMIQTRNSDGTVAVSKPPVGVPQATVDGNYVVNNGDGTYSVVSPSGQVRTVAYNSAANANTGSIINGVPNSLLLVGALLLFANKG